MYERFTDSARKVMRLAKQKAQRCNDNYISTEHILMGLVKVELGKKAEAELKELKAAMEKHSA